MSIKLNNIVSAERTLHKICYSVECRRNVKDGFEGELIEPVNVDDVLQEQLNKNNQLRVINLIYDPTETQMTVALEADGGRDLQVDLFASSGDIVVSSSTKNESEKEYSGCKSIGSSSLPDGIGGFLALQDTKEEIYAPKPGDEKHIHTDLGIIAFETLEKWVEAVNKAS